MSSLEGTFQSTWSFPLQKRSWLMSWYFTAFLASHLLSSLVECGSGSPVSRKHNTSWRDSLPYSFGSWSLTAPTVTSFKHSLASASASSFIAPPHIVNLAMLNLLEQPLHFSKLGGKLVTLTRPNTLNLLHN